MALAQSVLLTADDYRLFPETGPRYQLIEGELYMSPAPNRFHQVISRNLEFLLMDYLKQNPIGELYDAPFDVYLTEHNVFQPDKVYVANDRKFILTDEGANGAPNLVVEILSPSTASLDKESKRKVYAIAGVDELWIVDPEAKSIAVYHLQRDAHKPAAVYSGSASFTSTCFPA